MGSEMCIRDRATIAQIKASPATYYSRLVSVPDVTLSVPEGTTQFTEGMPQPTFTDAEGQTGKMRVLKGTDLIGTDIPTTPLTLVGLMTSKAVTSGPILAPRGAGDLQISAVAEPSIEVDIASFPEARGRVGEKVEIGTVHVKAVAMPQEVSIVPSGAVEGIFTTNVTTLPKGTYEKDITIYYEAKPSVNTRATSSLWWARILTQKSASAAWLLTRRIRLLYK